ncbi:follistatin-like [Branchiostoma floridae x Branchiostoma belcheri]
MAVSLWMLLVFLAAGCQAKSVAKPKRQSLSEEGWYQAGCLNHMSCGITVEGPFCASNGQTYHNHCAFLTAACIWPYQYPDDPPVVFEHDGRCDEARTQEYRRKRQALTDEPWFQAGCLDYVFECHMSGTEGPFCASNGVTYHNPCAFQSAACIWPYEYPDDPPVTVVHDGACAK